MSSPRSSVVITALVVSATAAACCAGCSDRPLAYRASPAPSGPGGVAPAPEQCNGVDDDRDGRIDEGCPIRLTTDLADDVSPELAGHRLAWVRGSALYVKDLPDGPERKIVGGFASGFAFDGRRAVTRSGAQFVLVDIETREETVITPIELEGELGIPSFAGDRIVWQQHLPRSWGWDESENVYAYDIPSRTISHVTNSHVMRTDALGDGNQLVWGDGSRFHDWINYNSYYDLYVADLAQGGGGRAIAVGGDGISTVPLALRKGRVLAYEEQLFASPDGAIRGTNSCQLVVYDVASGRRSELEPVQPLDGTHCDATQPGWQSQLTFDGYKPEGFDGDRVVRELHPLDESDLYLYDLASGAQYRLTDQPRRSQHPRIDGDLVVWQDDRNDQWDVYMMDVSDVAAGDLFPKGNPRNGDCDGGDGGGCVARVGRAWGDPPLRVSGDRIVYSGHDGVVRYDPASGKRETLAPILDPDATRAHRPQYVEVAADGDSVAWIREDERILDSGVAYSFTLYRQRRAGAAPEELDVQGSSIALSGERAAWLVYDWTAKTTSLAVDDGAGIVSTLLSDDPTLSFDKLALFGDWAVYQQRTHDGTTPDQWTIVARNLRSGEVRHPAEGLPAGALDTEPQIDGDTIIWSHAIPGPTWASVQARVYRYDLGTGMRTPISPFAAQTPTALALSGRHACWDDEAGVWLYNLDSAQMKLMSPRGRGCAVGEHIIAFFEGVDVYERRLDSSDP